MTATPTSPTATFTVAATTPVTPAGSSATTAASTSPTTRASASSTTTTIAGPTSTTLSLDDQIEQAIQDYFVAYQKCGEAPAACQPEMMVAPGSEAERIGKAFVLNLIASGLYFSKDARGSYLKPEAVQIVDPGSATARVCWYDAGILMSSGLFSGVTEVANEIVVSKIYEQRYALVGGVWLLSEETQIEELGPGDQCVSRR